uniref:Spike glycoprotein n=1 Tax=Bat coronavirus HKU9 TaxID=694006 RepID=A0A2P1M5J5_BCHK9|nr:spike glycoprotein [Rousettus bat coronavirus HKU9]
MFLIFLLLSQVNADRPSCFSSPDLTTTKQHIISNVSFYVQVKNLLLPDPYIAYSGQVLKQHLPTADLSNVIKYPITPDLVDATKGYVFNTTILPVDLGVFVHTWMYRQPSSSNLYCQQPFGVAFGNTFVEDRIAVIVIAPDNLGSWVHSSPRDQTTVHILVCSNATLCANPGFNRWGPAGNILVRNPLVEHDNSCFVNNSFNIPLSTARLNLAFLFKDGNLLVYHSPWLPHGDFNVNGTYPLTYFMTLPVGSNLRHAQYFQSVVRNDYAVADGKCRDFDLNLYIAPIVYKELLVQYSINGSVENAAECANSASDELYCVTGTFEPQTGVYALSRYRAQVQGFVRITQQADVCQPPYAALENPPQPVVWRRYLVRDCAFDFATVINNLPTYQLHCYGVSPSRLASMCYNTITIDVMRINTTHLNNLLQKVPDAFSLYNYAIPSDFYGCIHAYYLNVTDTYAIATQRRISPGGRQDDSFYINTVLGAAQYSGFNTLLYGLSVISLTPASGNKLVCPIANDTAVVTNQCVQYNLYGYTGTGVLNATTAISIPSDKVFSASDTGDIVAVRVNGTVYTIRPCVSVPISVGYHAGYERALLFNGLSCADRTSAITMPASTYWSTARAQSASNYYDTISGCVYNVDYNNATTVNQCVMPLGNSLCLVPNTQRVAGSRLTLVNFDPMYVSDSVTSLTPIYWVNIPTNFTLAATEEFIQTTAPKMNIDCARYLCGDSSRCLTVSLQYGTFCDDINKALLRVSQLLDTSLLALFKEFSTNVRPEAELSLDGAYNFTGLMGCLGSNCGGKSHRSALSELLYNKVKVADPGFMSSYQKCIDSQWGGEVRDLICTQTYNGISVLPPIVAPGMQALYTSLLVGAVASSGYTFGITSVGVIPFATQLQFRLNGIGVTTQVLVENQKLIASSFNKALTSIQEGFTATNQALAKMQAVINQHASQLQTLVIQLGNSFGAISSSLNEIFSRLEGLAADAEVDRLINGRMVVLNTYVTQLLIQASELRAQNQLAVQKISECVKAQSSRNDFCGNGTHVLSIPQLAPNGVLFIHYTYRPTEYAYVQTSAGLCYNKTGYAPKGGMFVLPNNTNLWHFTAMNFYNPVNITVFNTQILTSCSLNFTAVNYTVLEPLQYSDFDFDAQFEKFYKNISSHFNNTFDPNQFNFSTVDVKEQLDTLTNVVKQLNESVIDLKQMNVYEQTIKWPWYVWLAMIAGIVGLVLAVVMLLCMTNCCSCFKGMCSCKQCYYDELDDVYPAVRVHNKRTA